MENTLSIPVALLAQGSIRIDGITYYRHGNKVRACKSRRSPKKTRTEGEEESSSRFTEARKMWRIYRRAIGDLPIWKLMAKEMGINKSDSLFHSQNGGCFRPGEGVCQAGRDSVHRRGGLTASIGAAGPRSMPGMSGRGFEGKFTRRIF